MCGRMASIRSIWSSRSVAGRSRSALPKIPSDASPICRTPTSKELCFHRFWWLPGQAIALRIETSFKRDFARANIRGEWFDLDPAEAVEYIEAAIVGLGTWGLTQSQMEHLQDRWARKHLRHVRCRTIAAPRR